MFVHCHAGMGRTAIVCAGYLIYSGIAKSAQDAIASMQTQRKGTLGKHEAHLSLINFEKELKQLRDLFYPT